MNGLIAMFVFVSLYRISTSRITTIINIITILDKKYCLFGIIKLVVMRIS